MSPFPKPEQSFLCVPYKGLLSPRYFSGSWWVCCAWEAGYLRCREVSEDTEQPLLCRSSKSGSHPAWPGVTRASWQPTTVARDTGHSRHCRKHVSNLTCQPASHGRLRGASHRYSDVKPGAAAWTHHCSQDVSFVTVFFPTAQQPSGCRFFTSSVALLSALRQLPG